MSDPADVLPALRDALASGRRSVVKLPDGSGVLLNVDRFEVLSFNEAGMALVDLLRSGLVTVDDLAGGLEARFDVSRPQAAADVREFAQRLSEAL